MINEVIIYGPCPEDPDRKGGVAGHMRYLRYLTAQTEATVRFTYADWRGRVQLPRMLRRILGVIHATLIMCGREHKPGVVVHVNTSLYPKMVFKDLPFLLISLAKGYPVLLQIHGGRLSNMESQMLSGWLWSWVLGKVHILGVHPGPQWKELSVAGYNESMRRMLNMVPATPVSAAEQEGPPHFLFLGRMVEEKGVNLVLSAFLKLQPCIPQARLSLIGGGPLEEQVRKRAANSESAQAIQVTGFLQGQELQELLSRANIFVLPTWHQEGLPFSFLECAERGMAAIVSTGSAIPEVFQKDLEFLEVEAAEEDLYSKMKLLATDERKRRMLGRNAREAVHRCCTVDAVVPQFLSLYEELAASYQTRPGPAAR